MLFEFEICYNIFKAKYILAIILYREELFMKRVQSACICQTLHFILKEDYGHDYAVKLVKGEVENYKLGLEHAGTKFKIVDEHDEPDGSVMLKIIKQYNGCDVGDYLD